MPSSEAILRRGECSIAFFAEKVQLGRGGDRVSRLSSRKNADLWKRCAARRGHSKRWGSFTSGKSVMRFFFSGRGPSFSGNRKEKDLLSQGEENKETAFRRKKSLRRLISSRQRGSLVGEKDAREIEKAYLSRERNRSTSLREGESSGVKILKNTPSPSEELRPASEKLYAYRSPWGRAGLRGKELHLLSKKGRHSWTKLWRKGTHEGGLYCST